ncbi:MAG TPA: prepilin-type N-terminal cleavage/methylation domain-containing protein [Candidatus Binataceae bacterium]|nr:prepilin-type N-terminal cleavage/methylation domain-containing protein [Candidatus Binataceae bacterium]
MTSSAYRPGFRFVRCRGFTLLEVMIAVAVLGIAMMALLALDHQDLQGVIRARELTQASMLAQNLMTQAELDRYPDLGTTSGTFNKVFPGQFSNFQWQQTVTESGIFPDLRKVTVVVLFGPGFSRRFALSELLHNPLPPQDLITPGRGQAIPPASP